MAKKLYLCLAAAIVGIAVSGCTPPGLTESAGGTLEEGRQTMVLHRPEKIDGIAMDENAAVAIDTVVDVFSSPDIRSDRLTQLLYNQPVSVLLEQQGWSQVKTVDGSEGWVRSKFLERDISSIYGRNSMGKIIVTSREKAVYSLPKGGVTLKDTVMGTVFYAFNSSDDTYEVYLPGNATGWLRGSGVINIGLEDEIPRTTAEDFASTALKLKGAGYLWKGLSGRGIDSFGLLYLCARINGLALPREPEEQMETGSTVSFGSAEERAALKAGDLLFFTTDTDSGKESYAGIFVGDGKYIYASKASGYVKVEKIENNNPEGILTSVRRLF